MGVSLESSSERGRYGILLAALFAMILVVPPTISAGRGALALTLAYPAIFLASLLVAGEGKPLRLALFALVTLALVGDFSLLAFDPPAMVIGVRAIDVVLLGAITWLLLVRILRERSVSEDTILGGIAVYLLLGVLFQSMYGLLEYLAPGSFAGALQTSEAVAPGRYPGFVYYSFVTLTTLGFGDVTPVHEVARSLTIAEALVGQLYLAVLVASLVGMHLAGRSDRPDG